jgi:hypothetical protein
MFLEMHIGPLLIEKKFIDLGWCETITEREDQLRLMAEKMYRRNVLKVAHSRTEPVFYLDHVPSKTNYETHGKV